MRNKSNTKIISFIGYSGSGKTTFIVKLIEECKRRGLDLAVIKHDAHDFQIDREGKDSWRYRNSGADMVGIFSRSQAAVYGGYRAMFPKTWPLLEQDRTSDSIQEFLKKFPEHLDLIIIEGCRDSCIPKIGVSRKETGKGLSLDPSELVAVITDDETIRHDRIFSLDDIPGVADFIMNGSEIPETEGSEDFPVGLEAEEVLDLLARIPIDAGEEQIPINEAFGRICRRDYRTETDFPPFRRSPLDGYAFRAQDTFGAEESHPVRLRIIEEIPAGHAPEQKITEGCAAKILTGAPVPEGADCIEKYESVEFDEDFVTLNREYKPDSNIVPIGEDYHCGTRLLEKGKRIGAFDLSILAMLGKGLVDVFARPKAAFISTGSELISAEENELPYGKIRNSSLYTLASIAEQEGAEAINCGIVKDDVDAIAKALTDAADCDLIVTTGGASVGDYDLVLSALQKIGARVLFWKAKMKPGGACMAAVYGKCVILGLSGNPSSASVTMDLFGRLLLRKMSGLSDYRPKCMTLRLGGDINKKSPKGRYIRGKLRIEDATAWFDPNELGGNGTTSSNQGSDLLGVILPGTDKMKKGDLIKAYYAG